MQRRRAIWWKGRWKCTQKGRWSLWSLVRGILWPYPEDSVAPGMCLLLLINTINSSHLHPRHLLLHRSQASSVPNVISSSSAWSINLFFWIWLWLASIIEILLSPSASFYIFFFFAGWCTRRWWWWWWSLGQRTGKRLVN